MICPELLLFSGSSTRTPILQSAFPAGLRLLFFYLQCLNLISSNFHLKSVLLQLFRQTFCSYWRVITICSWPAGSISSGKLHCWHENCSAVVEEDVAGDPCPALMPALPAVGGWKVTCPSWPSPLLAECPSAVASIPCFLHVLSPAGSGPTGAVPSKFCFPPTVCWTDPPFQRQPMAVSY